MYTHLGIVLGCFCTTAARLVVATETIRLVKPEIFIIWPFTKMVLISVREKK